MSITYLKWAFTGSIHCIRCILNVGWIVDISGIRGISGIKGIIIIISTNIIISINNIINIIDIVTRQIGESVANFFQFSCNLWWLSRNRRVRFGWVVYL